MYGALKSLNMELLQTASEVRQFFDDDAERKLEILSRFLSEEKETQRASLSRKSDDPEWFKGNIRIYKPYENEIILSNIMK